GGCPWASCRVLTILYAVPPAPRTTMAPSASQSSRPEPPSSSLGRDPASRADASPCPGPGVDGDALGEVEASGAATAYAGLPVGVPLTATEKVTGTETPARVAPPRSPVMPTDR